MRRRRQAEGRGGRMRRGRVRGVAAAMAADDGAMLAGRILAGRRGRSGGRFCGGAVGVRAGHGGRRGHDGDEREQDRGQEADPVQKGLRAPEHGADVARVGGSVADGVSRAVGAAPARFRTGRGENGNALGRQAG